MTTFLNSLQQELNVTFTENGAVTNKSSLDPIVDFFSLAGAMRARPNDAADLFEMAFAADPQTAVRTLFYLRDIRGGQGERDVFRACLQRLLSTQVGYDGVYEKLVNHVPFYGRWDDLFVPLTRSSVELIKHQLREDCRDFDLNLPVSLLAKWMPSENASSPTTKQFATNLREILGMTPRHYRRMLSDLRGRIRLLEQDMSRNNWDGIDYAKLPAQAHRKHVKAFQRHTPERYQDYLDSVERGESTINVSNVYPYEIWRMVNKGQTEYANVAWENLPDYTRGNDALVMADVSASMTWEQDALAMATAVSLALYYAERNTGAFRGHFMTFSSEPELIKVQGTTLAERMAHIRRSPVGGSTNLGKALLAILRAAINSGAGDVPKTLYIISDMEFDQASHGSTSMDTVFRVAKAAFKDAGFELPHVVFWNVNARQKQAPATVHDGNVSLVSGCSPTIFSQVVEGKSPRELVDSVVNAERYQRIVL